MPPIDDSQIVADFVVESREHLADIESQLLAIEAAGAAIDEELVNQVFRAIHSIKGAAGFLGFSTLGRLAHEMENVLNLIRNRELVPVTEVIDVLLRAADTLRQMVENVDGSNDVDIAAHEAALQEAAAKRSEDGAPEPHSADDEGDEAGPKLRRASDAPTSADVAARQGDASTGSAGSPDANIRVAVSVLDRLMNLAGELVLSRNQLLQTVNSTDRHGIDSVAARVDQVTSELQETIMQTRMQTVGTVFQKFPRVVRDLSGQLGKQCRLVVEGQEVELDKSIIETIGDPLTHLIRNAVDHGIERPEVRAEAGKPAEGTITLRAFHQAGKVNISIHDDGGGIDAARLKEKAVARGLITAEQARELGDREAVRLIFHPGFSMAEKVTDVSGRGVGMDVVKTNIERLGGTVGIETQLGHGTTFEVKLPLTLAIVPSLVVGCAGHRYAIPQASISELVRVKGDEVAQKIEHLNSAEVFRLRGTLLPLVRLNQALNATSTEGDVERSATSVLPIIVVETGQLRYGLIVDRLFDSEEIVVKPLGHHMQECPCLAGATVLGDGRVALILDVTGIANHAELRLPSEDELAHETEKTATGGRESQTTLLFTNSPQEHFAIPMALITRLERIRSEQIDRVGGLEVLQYRGGSLPLLRLENHITAAPGAETTKPYIVVYKVMQREVGLIVPRLEDIRQVGTDVDPVTFREPGVTGAIVVDGNATRLLDLYELTQAAHPDWFVGQVSPPTIEGEAPRLLLVEDSDFFRRQLAEFFEADGYRVTTCEDGMVAWNTLSEPDVEFDLVVTDIEMPIMDGFELAKNIKEHPRFQHLPIVAVTSLAGEEDIERGAEVGIDDYQIKLDREQLLASVRRLLQASTVPVSMER